MPRDQPYRLAELLQLCGADVKTEWQPGGHALTRADVSKAYEWLEEQGHWPQPSPEPSGLSGGARSATRASV